MPNFTDQFSSVAQSCPTLCDPMNHNRPGLPVHHQPPESTQTHVHWVGDAIQHLILCRPLLLPPSIFPSIRVFSNESALRIRWPKYWSFSFSISPSNEHPGPTSFRMDWLDLLAVQGTLKSLLQHHSSKASILQCSAFFVVQLSHPYMTTGKAIALTRRTFVGKVMSLQWHMSTHGCDSAWAWPRGATPRLRSGVAARKSYSTSKVRSSREEIPHIQGKRKPSKTVGTDRGHQRADRLKPQSQTTSQSDHMDHSLV